MRLPLALAVATLLPAALAAEVSVKGHGSRLQVAGRAPLSEILDRIARHTGMKVVYDGAPPRQVVAADFRDVAASRVVISLLEGQSINFAATTDQTGEQVTTLMVLGSGGRVGAAPVPVAAAPRFPAVSTGYEPTDAELSGEAFDEAEEVPVDETELAAEDMEPEPEPEPVKEARPDAVLVPGPGPWTQPQPRGQFGIFNPVPAKPADGEKPEAE